MNCSACGAPSETGIGFCGACGHAFAPPAGRSAASSAASVMRADGPSMLLCSSCGVLRAERKLKCGHCEADYGSSPLRHPRAAGEGWACIECFFRCRACGFRVPLNSLDVDGAVLCARCGLDQAFDVSGWPRALRYAHAVTDMFGTHVHGADEDVARLGEKRCSVTRAIGGANAFEVIVSPGHPLCGRCHAPLQVTTTDAGATTATCAACATSESYAVPNSARKMSHGALQGIIAPGHKPEQAAVRVQQTPGAMAITCPTCSAPLPASAESKFVTCAYCKTVSRIPDHTWFQLNGREPVSESIWLLFKGVSQERASFEHAAQKHAHKAESLAEATTAHEERKRAEREERDRRQRDEQQEQTRQAEAREVAERGYRAKRERALRVRMALLLTGATLLTGVAATVYALTSQDPAPKKPATALRDTGASVTSARAAPVPTAVAVRSCACATRTAEGKDSYSLFAPTAAPTANESAWAFEWTHSAGFLETESTIGLGSAASAAVLPPRNPADKLRMAIACDGPVVALVQGNHATGWSGSGEGALWTTTLPGVFTAKANDPVASTTSPASAVDVACAPPLAVDGGAIALTLGNGKRVHLSLKDGRLK